MAAIREITSGLQFPEGPVALPDGSGLVVEIKRGLKLRTVRQNTGRTKEQRRRERHCEE